MTTSISPYPLQWPEGVARTPAAKRVRSPFRTSFDKAVQNVIASLRGFQKDSGLRIDHPVLSSNVDMLGRLLHGDPGVAAWFMMDGQWVSFAVDRFPDSASNVQAIHHIIEARRVELRYGGLAIVRQTFRAFIALPAPNTTPWWQILQVEPTATRADIEAEFRRLARERHPDAGGSDAMMADLNRARDEALKECP